MKRNIKYAIYKTIDIIFRIIEIPLTIVLLFASLWYEYIWEPIDDALLCWVENDKDNEI